jgi:serine/threonine protein kinase
MAVLTADELAKQERIAQAQARLDAAGAKYKLLDELGKGGMGSVFLGENERGEQFAIKLPFKNRDHPDGQRFLKDELPASIAASGHGVPQHVESNRAALYLVQEYIKGQTIKDLVKTHGALGEERALDVMLQVSKTIARLHKTPLAPQPGMPAREGIAHRDIKSENVMIRDGNNEAVVMDFGLGWAEGRERLTATGTAFGTPGWMAPEQLRAEIKTFEAAKACDPYAIGLLGYYVAYGQLPPTHVQGTEQGGDLFKGVEAQEREGFHTYVAENPFHQLLLDFCNEDPLKRIDLEKEAPQRIAEVRDWLAANRAQEQDQAYGAQQQVVAPLIEDETRVAYVDRTVAVRDETAVVRATVEQPTVNIGRHADADSAKRYNGRHRPKTEYQGQRRRNDNPSFTQRLRNGITQFLMSAHPAQPEMATQPAAQQPAVPAQSAVPEEDMPTTTYRRPTTAELIALGEQSARENLGLHELNRVIGGAPGVGSPLPGNGHSERRFLDGASGGAAAPANDDLETRDLHSIHKGGGYPEL